MTLGVIVVNICNTVTKIETVSTFIYQTIWFIAFRCWKKKFGLKKEWLEHLLNVYYLFVVGM